MARIIISILLLISFSSEAQIPMFYAHNYTSFVYDYLLDDYPSAYGAYSLRKLNSSYGGSCIKVRRSSDNTEQDIGFLNNVLDTNSLKTFVGANNGYVSVWYDQSGNSRDFTQTTNAEQPHIVTSGVIYRDSDLPSIDFGTWADAWWMKTASGYMYNFSSLSYIQVCRANVDEAGGTDYYGLIFGNTGGCTGFEVFAFSRQTIPVYGTRINCTYYVGGIGIGEGAFMTLYQQCLSSFYSDNSSTIQYRNDSTVFNSSTAAMPTLSFNGSYQLGKYNNSSANYGFFDMQELIIYSTKKSSDKTGIHDNINNFYSIY